MRKIAFLPLPSPIVRLAGDGCVPVAERDGEHASLFASPIVRLAGDGCVPQLDGYVLVMLGRLFQDSCFLFHLISLDY
ncbi:hypothetical protein RhiirA4_99656 [Rhizophagus irregularis]|uniref:Uncharacterized protein n=1 Tax=Rhizophagus irregularis TaxID=588596 RepID=A0A2I1HC79_9GLOM|nr:hypothetical protein RhiirA4_99656 [Rhizophagus irregularis]